MRRRYEPAVSDQTFPFDARFIAICIRLACLA